MLTVFSLLVFALQGYATQTHIHIDSHTRFSAGVDEGSSEVAKALPSHNGKHSKRPVDDDPAHCPLCQEYLLTGLFIAPAPIIFALPTDVMFRTAEMIVLPNFIGSVSHNWYGRAPPAD